MFIQTRTERIWHWKIPSREIAKGFPCHRRNMISHTKSEMQEKQHINVRVNLNIEWLQKMVCGSGFKMYLFVCLKSRITEKEGKIERDSPSADLLSKNLQWSKLSQAESGSLGLHLGLPQQFHLTLFFHVH